jgi:hypothetical protein
MSPATAKSLAWSYKIQSICPKTRIYPISRQSFVSHPFTNKSIQPDKKIQDKKNRGIQRFIEMPQIDRFMLH